MRLAVIFPGVGYHCDKPLLYYARKLLQEAGYERIVTLSYSYDGSNMRGNIEKMKEALESLSAQAANELEGIRFDDFDDIVFVSKSIGTIIASAYAYNNSIECRQVLYTPLEYTFDYPLKEACAFIGTADPWSNVDEVINRAKAGGVHVSVYDNLNHSLESGDAMRDIEIVSNVMSVTREFLRL